MVQYVDADGEPRSIGSGDVNDYLRALTGQDYTAKDFRTWAGTVLAALALRDAEAPRSETHARRELNAAIATVAKCLGNTVAVCRKCYIHPRVMETYMQCVGAQAGQEWLGDPRWRAAISRKDIENAVLGLLEGRKPSARKATKRSAPSKRSHEQAQQSTIAAQPRCGPGRGTGRERRCRSSPRRARNSTPSASRSIALRRTRGKN